VPLPERFCGGDSLQRGAISSVCTFTFTFNLQLFFSYFEIDNDRCSAALNLVYAVLRD